MSPERRPETLLTKIKLPFFLTDTGAGRTTTFSHQVHTTLGGEPFPVVAAIHKGYSTGQYVYQAVPHGIPYARVWADGSANPNVGWQSGIQYLVNGEVVGEIEAPGAGVNREKLQWVLGEVEGWQNGRRCHWPPGRDRVEPVDGLRDLEAAVRSPAEAASLVMAVWDTFPPMAEWQVNVGSGTRVEQRGLTIAPGLTGRWRVHYPPMRPRLWRHGLQHFTIAHHELTFSQSVYLIATDTSPRHPPQADFYKTIAWVPVETAVSVHDTMGWAEDVSGQVQGIFWIRHSSAGEGLIV